jgi:hypothetical protein
LEIRQICAAILILEPVAGLEHPSGEQNPQSLVVQIVGGEFAPPTICIVRIARFASILRQYKDSRPQ